MKKYVIGALVGAIIIFAWQFLSWSLLAIHAKEAKYLPAQDSILNILSSTIKEDGRYLLPTSPPGTSQEEMQKAAEQRNNQPLATITYKSKFVYSMSSPMIWGFVIDIILVVLLISILTRGGLPTFIQIFTGSIAVGIFSFLWGPYTQYNWFQVPWESIQGHLIDAVAAWGLCGLWLGWWLRR